jgi:hypothetical protein
MKQVPKEIQGEGPPEKGVFDLKTKIVVDKRLTKKT